MMRLDVPPGGLVIEAGMLQGLWQYLLTRPAGEVLPMLQYLLESCRAAKEAERTAVVPAAAPDDEVKA